MKKLIATVAALLFPTIVLIPAIVLAADLAPKAEEPLAPIPVPYSWAGFYTGVQAGYTWMDPATIGPYATNTGTYAGVGRISPRGGFGGLYAGYNYQFDSHVVVGAEGDVGFGDVNNRTSILYQGSGSEASSRLDWFGSARLRAGYAIDRFMPYITGGVAFEHSSVSAYYAGLGYAGRDSDTRAGWTLGGGLEYAFTDNLIGRLEYRFSDYGHYDSAPIPVPGVVIDTRTRQSTSDVRAGVSYKF